MGAENEERCGLCGTSMAAGFTVCKSCGARRLYERSGGVKILSILVFLFAVALTGQMFEMVFGENAIRSKGLLSGFVEITAYAVGILAVYVWFRLFPERVSYVRE